MNRPPKSFNDRAGTGTGQPPAPVGTVVVLSDTTYCDGGAAKITITSAIGLARRGLRVIFVGGFGLPDPDLAAAGVEVICLDQPFIGMPAQRAAGAMTALWNRDSARQLDHILSGLDAADTVVHLHTWTKSLSSSVVPVIKRHGIPLVLTLHDYFTACPNGGFYDYQAEAICHRRPLSAGCLLRNCDSRHRIYKVWRTVRQVIQRTAGPLPGGADALIAISDFSLTVLRPYLPATTPVHRVDNPIESHKRAPAQPERQQGMLFIGRLSPEKGPHILAAAGREAGVPITFAGDGAMRADLASAYPEHSFPGWCSEDSLHALIDSTRALVLPSLWYETQGLVVPEAASRGVPAIVSTGCAASDSVEFDVTGLGVTAGSQSELATALRRLSDNSLVKRLGNAAYDRFWANPPSLDRHVSRLLEVYASVAKTTAPKPKTNHTTDNDQGGTG